MGINTENEVNLQMFFIKIDLIHFLKVKIQMIIIWLCVSVVEFVIAKILFLKVSEEETTNVFTLFYCE